MFVYKFQTFKFYIEWVSWILISAKNLEYKMLFETKDTEHPKSFFVIFDTLDFYWNLEILLELNDDVMDLVLINKHFNWDNLRFKVSNKIAWVDRIIFRGNLFNLKYNLGGRRELKFTATNVETIDTFKPWNKQGKGCMLYVADTF